MSLTRAGNVQGPRVLTFLPHAGGRPTLHRLPSRTHVTVSRDRVVESNPPNETYDNVSVGDVGYLDEGSFIRMFNVMLPWDHPWNRFLGRPMPYDPLRLNLFTNAINKDHFDKVDHYSRFVTVKTNAGKLQTGTPDELENVTYKFRNRGALLSLPNGGHREYAMPTKVFENYMRDHVDSWFDWAQKNKLGVKCMENLILVYGCTLVTSWAAAAFVDDTSGAEISLASRIFSSVGASFVWGNVRGRMSYHNSHYDPQNPPTMANQCVFIKGLRAKRILFRPKRMRAAAEPSPDDPDDSRDDEVQVSRLGVPGASKYRDPLVGVLDYIAEKCQVDNAEEGILALTRHDDLRFIKDVETLTAGTIEEFLHGKQMPVLVENGVATLRGPADNELWVSDKNPSHHGYLRPVQGLNTTLSALDGQMPPQSVGSCHIGKMGSI
ncbi:hypothetical protein BGY98DRAFT_1173350 [Russula aff. rugulosa BPL654]|nr:hypothetical protein BGY98DRAFT_1173350 [Russula aff. rugulosa BPL654]